MPLRLPNWAAALLLAVWACLCYAPAVRGPFFFDDEHFIQKNEMVHSLAHIPEIYTSTVTAGAAIRGNFYRPNQQLLYTLLYSAVGETTAVPYHLLAVALHAADGVLLFFWLLLLGLAPLAALGGAALFLVHPVQTEAVAYISGLADPLALFFMLAALVVFTRKKIQSFYLVTSISGLMLLALFSKESGVVLAPLIVATALYMALTQQRRLSKAELATVGSTVLLAGIWSVLKLTVLNFTGGFGLTVERNAYTDDIWLRLKTFVSVLWDYAVLIFFPKDLNYEKPYRAYADLLTMRGAFGLAALALGLAALAGYKRWPRVALAAALFAAGLLPFVGIVPLNAMYLEHWLYVPMLGVALLAAAFLEQAFATRARTFAALGAAALLLVASGRTVARSGEWADVERFYLNELALGGPSIRIYNNLGMYYSDVGKPDEAIRYYQLAAEAGSSFPQPHHNLARLYAETGRTAEALAELHAALRIDPSFIYSIALLYDLLRQVGDQRRMQLVDAVGEAVKHGEAYDFPAFEREVFGP